MAKKIIKIDEFEQLPDGMISTQDFENPLYGKSGTGLLGATYDEYVDPYTGAPLRAGLAGLSRGEGLIESAKRFGAQFGKKPLETTPNAIDTAIMVGAKLDPYTAGPVRAGLSSLQRGEGLVDAFQAGKEQFAEPIKESTKSVRDMLIEDYRRAGIPPEEYMKSVSDVVPGLYNETGEGWKLKKGGLLDPTRIGAFSLAGEAVVDPTTYVPFGIAAKGARMGLEAGGRGLIGGMEAAAKAAESVPYIGKTASSTVKAMTNIPFKVGELFTGIPKDAIKTYFTRMGKIDDIIAKHGSDVVGASAEVKNKILNAILEAKKSWNEMISGATKQAKHSDIVLSGTPIRVKPGKHLKKLDKSLQPESWNEIVELQNILDAAIKDNGVLPLSKAFKLWEVMSERASGAYKKAGQLYKNTSDAQRAAKEITADLRAQLGKISPEFDEAMKNHSRLHELDSMINSSVWTEGKPSGQLYSAGAGVNKDLIEKLKELEKLTGKKFFEEVENLAAYKYFDDIRFDPRDMTDKAAYRALIGAAVGSLISNDKSFGAAIGAILTSPMALKAALRSARVGDRATNMALRYAETPAGKQVIRGVLRDARVFGQAAKDAE